MCVDQSLVKPVLRCVRHLYLGRLTFAGLRCLPLDRLDAISSLEGAWSHSSQLQPIHPSTMWSSNSSSLLAGKQPFLAKVEGGYASCGEVVFAAGADAGVGDLVEVVLDQIARKFVQDLHDFFGW